MFKSKYQQFKTNIDANRIYRLSFVSLIVQIVSGISVIIFMLLSLTLLQLSEKIKVDSVLLSNNINNSSQVVMTDVFNTEMPNIDSKVTKVMIDYFIETTFAMHFDSNEILRKFGYGAEIYYLTTYPEWEAVVKFMGPIVRGIAIDRAEKTSSVHIISTKNLTSNLWQSYFDMRIYNPRTEEIDTQRYVMNVRVGYFPERVVMANTFTNPLGFAITEFNIAKAKN